VTFRGPSFQCKITTLKSIDTSFTPGAIKAHYSGAWQWQELINFAPLELNLTRYLGLEPYGGDVALSEISSLLCQPVWGTYDITVTYYEGQRIISNSFDRSSTLEQSFRPGITSITQWTQHELDNLEMINYYGLLDAVGTILSGSYDQVPAYADGDPFNFTLPNGTTLELSPAEPSFTHFGVTELRGHGASLAIRKSAYLQGLRSGSSA